MTESERIEKYGRPVADDLWVQHTLGQGHEFRLPECMHSRHAGKVLTLPLPRK
jgi:hypothetical protein